MKSKLKLVILLLIATIFVWGKEMKPEKSSKKFENFDTHWENVNTAYTKGLPKTALEEVTIIFQQAKKENNAPQIIKSLIHKIKYLQEVEEDSAYKIFNELEKEIKESEYPTKPVLQALAANLLWSYYQQNRYTYLNRTQTVDFKLNDIRTWDLRKIIEKVVAYHQSSLKNSEKLKQTKIDILDPVLTKGTLEGRFLRPTLFDFLAHRAVDFFSYSEAGLTRPADEFSINTPDYFAPEAQFSDFKISTQDALAFTYYAAKVFQELTRFHLNDKDPAALIDITLKRLTFIYNKSVLEEKHSLYEQALKSLMEKYKAHPSSTEAAYLLGIYYNNLGNQYHPKTAPQYKEYKKTAYGICKKALEDFPKSLGASQCNGLMAQILTKSLEIQVEKVNPVEKSIKALLKFQNNTQYSFRIYKTNFREIRERGLYSTYLLNAYLTQKPAREWQIKVPESTDYQAQWSEIEIPGLENGEYLLIASTGKKFDFNEEGIAHCLFAVTDIAYIQRNATPSGMEFYLLNRETGHPLAQAQMQIWRQEYREKLQKYVYVKGEKLISDSNGYLNIPLNKETNSSFYLEFIYGNDHFFPEEYFYNSHPYHSYENPVKTFFFTDRSIYRPGQTVYFKGIMIKTDPENREKNEILPNYPAYVNFYDVNSQQIAHLALKTNEFGTFNGSFQIPTGRLNGNMSIASGYGRTYFSVEEYKRPKFSVEITKTEESYRVNDIVKVKGTAKAFAGYNIDNAAVKYRVVRTAYFPYWWYYWGYYPSSPQTQVANGTAKTNGAGEFLLEFKAIPDLNLSKSSFPAFRYEVSVDITDINGETRSARKIFSIGYTALQLSAELEDEINRESKNYTVQLNSTSLSGEFIPAKGQISVYLLKKPEKSYRNRYWNVPTAQIYSKEEFAKKFPHDEYDDETNFYLWQKEKTMMETSFNTGEKKELELQGLPNWEPGKYLLEMESKDRFGQGIKEIKYFTVFSSRQTKIAYPALYWGKVLKNTVKPGENAEILLGSSENGVKAIYELELKNKLIKREFIELNQEQKTISFPVLENYRGNINAHITFVKHNRVIQEHYTFYVPWNNKNLDIRFESFRNKLVPGEKEEWKIQISGKDKEAVAAEMAATLYDASLDTFRPHNWGLSIFPYYSGNLYWNLSSQFTSIYTQLQGKITEPYYYYNYRSYDSLDLFGFYWRYYYSSRNHRKMKSGKGRSAHLEDMMMEKEAMKEESIARPTMAKKMDSPAELKKTSDESSPNEPLKQEPSTKEDLSQVKARTNFNETAFFYPELKTNKKGEVIISFTIPESLTEWKMMGFAHTKDLATGVIYNKLVTQKDLMVEPNLPRFFREGDKISLSSKVVNLSENQIEGEAELVIMDTATLKPLNGLFKNQNARKTFSSKKGETSLLTWEIQIPSSIDTVTVRIVAKSGKFSDGEEKAVPVLKNSMLVTESMPLPIRGKETKKYVFENLAKSEKSDTLKHHKLTLEFNSNPAWYAVLALPYMMEYPYECMEQTFTRYYANSIAYHVVKNSPEIKRVFEIWKSKNGSNALTSNLEKNQELKALLLQETPWVLDAQDETQRKQRIALLFDNNKVEDELSRAIKKLEQGQMAEGAWPWFSGMQANPYITAYIVKGFAHLKALNVLNPNEDSRIKNILSKAVPYLDREIKKDYDYLVREGYKLKEMHIDYAQLYYLYARSYFQDIPVAKENKKAHDYYLGQAKKYWIKFNRYSQGMIAIFLNRYQQSKAAKAILRSIKEHALYSEEMGMYWKENYGYYWYEAPVEMQALFIEAFDEILKDSKSVDEMKIWLLKQKQTTDWKTTIATANACYALLLKGESWIKDTKMAEITLGKMKIDPKSIPGLEAEIGTGYFKTSWAGPEIKPDMGKITINNPNKGPAWGGIYWQYFENLDKITPHKTPLQLVKKLFLEQPSATGPVLKPVTKETQLKPGDRIKVRIELRVDRNMEYVHMKDMRASGFEPENVISRYKWQDGLGYYESTKDASTNFFMDYLPKGTYVFEYPLRVSHQGDFSNGITTIQCMYAPEFTSHSEGIRVKVGK